MKFSTAYTIVSVSSVITPATATDALFLRHSTLEDARTPLRIPRSCPALLQEHFNTDLLDAELHDALKNCLEISYSDKTHLLAIDASFLLKMSLPMVSAQLSTNDTKDEVGLPSLKALKHATETLQENVHKLSERADFVRKLDLPDQVDLIVCGLKLHGVRCEDGHFLPKTELLRQVSMLGLRLSGKHIEIAEALHALHETRIRYVQITRAMIKTMQSLITTYPPSGHDTAIWMKTYRLIRANINVIHEMLNLSTLEKQMVAQTPVSARSSV